MLSEKQAAGKDIESMCTKCKVVLNHTIIAMVEGLVKRVKCNTCGSEHNYRPPKEAKTPVKRSATAKTPAASRTKIKRDPLVVDQEEWEMLSDSMDVNRAVPYDMNGAFRLKALVAHPLFGVGIVSARHESKMEVLFKAGRKLLCCR
jgi:hypothetical protein